MTIKEFITKRPYHSFYECSIIGYVCRKTLTPFITPWCINHKIRPNIVTLWMIIVGFISGCVLLIPSVWCKLLSSFLYFVWFALDISDGEVARYTNQCSEQGKYLDWFAHQVTHPMFIIGMWITFVQFYSVENYIFLTIFAFVLISSELTLRMLLALNDLTTKRESKSVCGFHEDNNDKRSIFQWIRRQISYFPNFVGFCPILLVVDIWAETYIFYYVFTVVGIVYSCNIYKNLAMIIRNMLTQ